MPLFKNLNILPLTIEIKYDTIAVTFEEFEVIRRIGLPQIMMYNKDTIFESEVLSAAQQINVMMFGKEDYPSLTDSFPLQLRQDEGKLYNIYVAKYTCKRIDKYCIRRLVKISEGLEVIMYNDEKETIYGVIVFIEPVKLKS